MKKLTAVLHCLLVSLCLILASAFSASASGAIPAQKPEVRIAIPKSSNKNVPNFIKEYNQDPTGLYTILYTEVTSSDINVDDFDGLIIPGGTHVHPSFYKQKVKCKKHKYNKELDQLEMELFQKFKDQKKPVLGICRGAQLINVALKGTLKQDIGKKHYKWAYRATKTVKKSRMRALFGSSVKTLHYHHQAVKKLGTGLKATMKDKDGTIEAFEHKTLPIIGVQFHPESMYSRKKGTANGKKLLEYYFGLCSQKIKY